MKTGQLTILGLLLLLPFMSNAQAPGYLGKKFILTAGIHSSIAINGPTQNNKGGEPFGEAEEQLGLNLGYRADVSYVLSRYGGINISGEQYYTGMSSTARTLSLSSNGGNDFHDLFHRLNVRTIGVSYSFFKRERGALAPLGYQWAIGLRSSYVDGEIIDKRTDFNSALSQLLGQHNKLNINQKISNIYHFTWEWSNTKIFFDQLVLKAGIGGAVPFFLYESNASDGTDNQATYEENAYNRIWKHDIIRINLSVGYLLF